MDIRRQLGLNVQRLRRARGWSQEEFAERAGLHRTYISGVERGVRNPTITIVGRLAEALEATIGELAGYVESGPASVTTGRS
jgi:transcriptional regulator with XRE-family HTH domain